uniref:Uncharacterized protein n=2 Tax=Oryza TaxID=4527 RepID=Q10MB6_ORYSJ|nr:hypothetical protein LOC_Os03g20070 [Oryza sativa Japonica Group]
MVPAGLVLLGTPILAWLSLCLYAGPCTAVRDAPMHLHIHVHYYFDFFVNSAASCSVLMLEGEGHVALIWTYGIYDLVYTVAFQDYFLRVCDMVNANLATSCAKCSASCAASAGGLHEPHSNLSSDASRDTLLRRGHRCVTRCSTAASPSSSCGTMDLPSAQDALRASAGAAAPGAAT